MYANFYYLFKDLFGVELPALMMINSFGFFVAVAFLLGSYLLAIELKRKEEEGLLSSERIKVMKGEAAKTSELATSGILGFVIGFKFLGIIFDFDTFIENTQDYILSTEGNLFGGILTAALFAYLKYREKEKEKLAEPKLVEEIIHPYQQVSNITIIAAVTGIIGAKIFHNLENPAEFLNDPIGSLLSFSGLTMYGGLIFGITAVLYYAKKHRISYLPLLDAGAPAVMLAYAAGRVGCQVAGDGDWGIENTAVQPNWLSFLPEWTWAYNYPGNVNKVGIPIPGCEDPHCYMLANPVFPTPFYEIVMCSILFFVLWSIRKKIKIPGMLFSIYLIFNGVERFFIEKIRVNETYALFGASITQAEIISSFLILLGIIGIWFTRKKAHA